jgi:hypothetical protein
LGQTALLRALPERDVVVALSINRAGAGAEGAALLNQVLEHVGVGSLVPPPLPKHVPHAVTDPQAIAGSYARRAGALTVHLTSNGPVAVVDIEEPLESERLRLEGSLEPGESGMWHLQSDQGPLPILFLGGDAERAACALVGGRGHGRVRSDATCL